MAEVRAKAHALHGVHYFGLGTDLVRRKFLAGQRSTPIPATDYVHTNARFEHIDECLSLSRNLRLGFHQRQHRRWMLVRTASGLRQGFGRTVRQHRRAASWWNCRLPTLPTGGGLAGYASTGRRLRAMNRLNPPTPAGIAAATAASTCWHRMELVDDGREKNI